MKRSHKFALCTYVLVAVFTFGQVLSNANRNSTIADDAQMLILASGITASVWPLYWSYRFSEALK